MLLIWGSASKGADPGVAVSGLLVWRLRSHTSPVNLRQNSAAKHEMIIKKQALQDSCELLKQMFIDLYGT